MLASVKREICWTGARDVIAESVGKHTRHQNIRLGSILRFTVVNKVDDTNSLQSLTLFFY